MIFDKNRTSGLNLCWIGLGHLNVVDTICWCFLSEDVIIVSVFYGFFSRSSHVDNEFSRNKLHPTLRTMGSQVTGGNWRSQTSAKNTSKPLDFAGSLVILRETSFFTRSRCLIQPRFFRQNSWIVQPMTAQWPMAIWSSARVSTRAPAPWGKWNPHELIASSVLSGWCIP